MTLAQQLIQLAEVFDRPQPYEWVKKSSDLWIAEFEVGDRGYEVDFVYFKKDNVWDIDFVLWGDSGPELKATKTGNSIAVFSTVASMFKDWIKVHDGVNFQFSAKGAGRNRLYDHLAKIIAKKYNYSFRVEGPVDHKGYHFTKKD